MSLGDCRCPSAMTCCFSLKNKDSNSSSSSIFCPIAALDVLLRVRELIGAAADLVVGLPGLNLPSEFVLGRAEGLEVGEFGDGNDTFTP